jgi:hypothetical protein
VIDLIMRRDAVWFVIPILRLGDTVRGRFSAALQRTMRPIPEIVGIFYLLEKSASPRIDFVAHEDHLKTIRSFLALEANRVCFTGYLPCEAEL